MPVNQIKYYFNLNIFYFIIIMSFNKVEELRKKYDEILDLVIEKLGNFYLVINIS